MSDNVQANATTTAGAVFASDELAGVHHPRVKIEIGADGSATDVSETNPMPVRLNDGSANLDVASLDYDSGAGTVNRVAVGIALPGSGGPVAGGTDTDPIRIDPTGTTPQPVIGIAAHDAPASGVKPFLMAGRANDTPALIVPVSPGDITDIFTDTSGRPVVVLNAPAGIVQDTIQGPAPFTLSGSGTGVIVAAPPLGYSIHVTEVDVVNSNGATDTIFSLVNNAVARTTTFLRRNCENTFHFAFNPPWKLDQDTSLDGNLFGAGDVFGTVHFYIGA